MIKHLCDSCCEEITNENPSVIWHGLTLSAMGQESGDVSEFTVKVYPKNKSDKQSQLCRKCFIHLVTEIEEK